MLEINNTIQPQFVDIIDRQYFMHAIFYVCTGVHVEIGLLSFKLFSYATQDNLQSLIMSDCPFPTVDICICGAVSS